MRQLKIISINASSGGPGTVVVGGDFTSVFQGSFYRDPTTGFTLPPYTANPPSTSALIVATQFDIIGNVKYAGRYTVYTSAGSNDVASTTFAAGNTTIRVNEVVAPLVAGDSASVSSDGYVTNISTYLLTNAGTNIVISPGIDLTTYPIEFIGRNATGWGEVYAQNFINLASNFASSTGPANPFVGQQYYDTDDGQMRVWSGSSWDLTNHASFGTTFRFTQSSAAKVWTVNHGLNLPAPYIAFVQFFVDRGAGPKVIMPADVTFVSATQLTVTFTNAEIGYVLVRA